MSMIEMLSRELRAMMDSVIGKSGEATPRRSFLNAGLLSLVTLLLTTAPGLTQEYAEHEVPPEIPAPDLEAELEAFEIHETFEIAVFASNPRVANPVSLTWDERGRAWVAGSQTYPHLRPGQVPDDRIVILEDDDGDFQADRSTVFADGLLVPHAVLPTAEGVYVCASTELLLLRDTDGDDRADSRTILFSGFGNEDVHHVIHTLVRGPGGRLYFSQSININSLVETPLGPRRLDGSGIWRFDPRRGSLEVHVRGIVNPWGHVFDRWGNEFATDGAGSQGLHFIFPGASLITAVGASDILAGLGSGHPKYCGLEILDSSHVPEPWRGRFITCDFRANRIVSFEVEEEKSGFRQVQKEDLLRSSHVSFRPVHVRVGPDGAIYVVDWYNPIIDHGEVDFHHPARDRTHGRIWRITAKGQPRVRPPALDAETPRPELFEALDSPEAWTRETARRLLQESGPGGEGRTLDQRVKQELFSLLASVDPESPRFLPFLVELLWVYQGTGDCDLTPLVTALLGSADHRARAAAVGAIGSDPGRVRLPLEHLEAALEDDHPRVRLEALRSLAALENPRAARLVVRQTAGGDRFLDHALSLALAETSPRWLAAIDESGELDGVSSEQLLDALLELDGPEGARELARQWMLERVPGEREVTVLEAIARRGSETSLGLVFSRLHEKGLDPGVRADLLRQLLGSTLSRGVIPVGELDRVRAWLSSDHESLKTEAVRAVGIWKLEGLLEEVNEIAREIERPSRLLVETLNTLALLGDGAFISRLARGGAPRPMRLEATLALARLDVEAAAISAATLLTEGEPGAELARLLDAFLYADGGPEALAEKLEGVELPEEVARAGFEATRLAPDPHPELLRVFRESGGAPADFADLTPERRRTLVDRVARLGIASKGEEIYRREELACFTCHALGGAGGKVGPDLSSIGTTSPPDYLIESLLEPGKKVKEYYRSQRFILSDGRVLNGIPRTNTPDEIVLVLETGEEIRFSPGLVVQSSGGPSLMPTGLVDSLAGDEFLHLVRFLSELGRVGPYSIPSGSYVRRWRARLPGQEPEAGKPLYSKVSGALPVADLERLAGEGRKVMLSFEIRVEVAGELRLTLNSTDGLAVQYGGRSLERSRLVPLTVSEGLQTLEVEVDLDRRNSDVRIEISPAPGGKARFELVGGP